MKPPAASEERTAPETRPETWSEGELTAEIERGLEFQALGLSSAGPSGRASIVRTCVRHLVLVAQANRRINLTRVSSAREMAVKHVVDSLLAAAWLEDAESVLDLGSGAGFPGIPLAARFPDKRFILAESVRKKASFLDGAIGALDLPNASVRAERGEAVLKETAVDVVVARAVAPTARLLQTLAPVARRFGRLVLYKGPSGAAELEDARAVAARAGLRGVVALRSELPDGMGSRTVLVFTPSRR